MTLYVTRLYNYSLLSFKTVVSLIIQKEFMDFAGNIISLVIHSLFFSCQASFETPWFAAGKGCNTSFFYHMSDRTIAGNSMGTLSVDIKTVDKTWFMVFRKAGDQGNTWHQGAVDLSVRIYFFPVDKLFSLSLYMGASPH